jgi:hypothetical protein
MLPSDGHRPESLIATAYGAAVAVCANPKAAEHVTSVALESHAESEREVTLRTLRLGVRAVPRAPFQRMTLEQREAVALACPGNANVDEIAATLGVSAREAKRRMLDGLRAAAAEAEPRAQAR